MTNEELELYLKNNFRHTSSFISGFILFIFDAISIFLSFGIAFFIVNLFDGPGHNLNFHSFFYYTIYIPLILMVFGSAGMYPGIMISPTDEVRKFSVCSFFCFMGIASSVVISGLKDFEFTLNYLKQDSNSIVIFCVFLLAFVVATILLPGIREVARNLFAKCSFWGVPCVIYSSGSSADTIINRLIKNRAFGYHPAIIINDNPTSDFYNGIPVFTPDNEEVNKIIRKKNIKVALFCDYKSDVTKAMISYRYTIQIKKNPGVSTSTQHIKDIAGIIGFASTHNLTFKTCLFAKRLMDIFVVLLFSPVLIPLFLLIIFFVKVTSKGPAFYGHKRVGKNGKEFKCWKFRSMCIDSQEQLEKILATDPVRRAEWEKDRKFTDDPRVTKFGKFLRKTSLDELPQLINVLTGEMSLVGPRPVTEGELSKYGDQKDFVLQVTPGLTGMWQISGRSDTGYEERVTFDAYYIQNWSVWLDIWILIKTVWVVLKGKGAY